MPPNKNARFFAVYKNANFYITKLLSEKLFRRKNMNKAELIAAVAGKTGLSKKDSEKAVNATFQTIEETIETGEKVQLVGFGVFDVKTREARIGRNPKTKEEIKIPASRVPVFKAGKALKDSVDK